MNVKTIMIIQLTHFMPVISFDTPENIRKPEIFWCFLRVSKEISDMKWVNNNVNLKIGTTRLVKILFKKLCSN